MCEVKNFSGFCAALLESGFSMGGANSKGIYAAIPIDWEEQDVSSSPIQWHTGNPDTDPWEWRMRVLEERKDIAYAKVFFRASGYIAKNWAPHFLAVRRQGSSLEELYEEGKLSQTAKRIYEFIAQHGNTPLHVLKQLGGFGKADSARFERAMVELQMKLFITICGREQKKNKYGEGYGWNSTVFCTVEQFWTERHVELLALSPAQAYDEIAQQVYRLNPIAEAKTIHKFIMG